MDKRCLSILFDLYTHFYLFVDLNLTLNAGELQGKETNLGRCTEDDVAMSLLDLSKTPVHGTPTFIKQNSLSKPLLHTGSTKSPLPADVVSYLYWLRVKICLAGC